MSNFHFKVRSTVEGLSPAVGCVPLIFALMFLVSSAYYEASYLVFGTTTTGVIDRFERPRSTTYVFIRFRDAADREHVIRQTLLMREKFTVGQIVPLRYLSEEPPRGRIETFWQFWHPLILKPVLGLICLAAAILLFTRRFFGLSAQKR